MVSGVLVRFNKTHAEQIICDNIIKTKNFRFPKCITQSFFKKYTNPRSARGRSSVFFTISQRAFGLLNYILL